MEPIHLWWNGYDHAPGATAEDATRWLMEETGLTAEDCQGDDGWEMLPDDMYLRYEDGVSRPDEDEKALDMALAMVARRPIPARPACDAT